MSSVCGGLAHRPRPYRADHRGRRSRRCRYRPELGHREGEDHRGVGVDQRLLVRGVGVDQVDSDGGVGYAHTGGLVNVGLYGSGIEVYLPASANLANVSASTKLIWDATNLCLDVWSTGDAVPVKIKSALVDGYKLKKNASTGLVEYVATKAIKVQL